ncbi:MAG TPA: MerR family transcriptional regulator [Actinomycetota bacterium]|nr:MerR family transcriptional regulator [Actinomycetota bacterium]
MPLSRSRDYLSIGEVLESVRGDFPDVSISKIRFLESEGLIQPERTASGYRKFYDADVERLRYILSLQRDQFLPLKVIKDRLAGRSNGGEAPPAAPAPQGSQAATAPVAPAATELNLTQAELAEAAGLSERELQGLTDFGIVAPDKAVYDGDDLIAAKAAAGLFRYGVEPRHLKMYRNFAERERALFEQIVSPLARRKDPDAQRQAAAAIRDIARLAQQFRDAILRSSTRDLL